MQKAVPTKRAAPGTLLAHHMGKEAAASTPDQKLQRLGSQFAQVAREQPADAALAQKGATEVLVRRIRLAQKAGTP